jgi:DMSO/TMAO reductase YedYZ heme-binding membrane subunit
MAVVLLTSWLRRWVPPRLWRQLHGAGFAVFVLSSAHGLLAGSDTGMWWMQVLYVSAVGTVTLLALVRFALRDTRRAPRRREAPVSAPAPIRSRT